MLLKYNRFVEKIKSASLIMLIGKEDTLLEVLSEYLFSQGFSVMTATSTELALKKTTQINPDIYVLDIMMEKKKGNAFLEKLEKSITLSNTPFIFLTANGMTKDRIQGYGLGCSAYITKPFDPSELLAVIKNILLRHKNVKEICKITSRIKKIRIQIETFYYLKHSLCLTPREKTVMDGVILGCSNTEIAFKYNTSTRNIEKYVTRLLYKTKTKNRTELTRFIYGIPTYKYIKADDGNRTRE
jgi:DNA-binding NarL/FixJ family response regulator